MLTPASTDAVNRASRQSYGEATGITQTVRNYAASLGLAVLGTILVAELRSRVTSSLVAKGLTAGQAASQARRIAESQAGGAAGAIPHFIRLDFAYATRSVFLVMAGVMAAATLVAFFGIRPGVQQEADQSQLNLREEPEPPHTNAVRLDSPAIPYRRATRWATAHWRMPWWNGPAASISKLPLSKSVPKPATRNDS